MTYKKRILFVNDEMEIGGVARVLNTLMSALPRDEYTIDCLVLHPQGLLLNEIPKDVNLIFGSPFFSTVDQPFTDILSRFDLQAMFSKIRLFFYMKSGLIENRIKKERAKMNLQSYDVEIAAKEGFCTIFTAFGESKRKINWVLTDYSVCNYSKNHMKIVKKALRNIDLNIADSKQALDAYKQVFDIDNGVSIHNLMDVDKIYEGMKELPSEVIKKDALNVISVIRFHPQKCVERMIMAHKYALEHGIDHYLYLIGGGETEPMLRSLVKTNNLTNVLFLGYKKNPYADIATCDLFILTSLYEGFATIINESLIATTPVLTTRVSGVEEQITNPNYGWVVENNQVAFNVGYMYALKDKQKLKCMKQELKSYHYPNDRILKEFMDVL